MSFILAQLGARMHYAVPKILFKAGMLKRLFTDFYAKKILIDYQKKLKLANFSSLMAKMMQRRCDDIDDTYVTAFILFGIEYSIRLKNAKSETERIKVYTWAGKKFCNLINRHDWGGAHNIYTFNSAGLESMEKAKKMNIKCYMEQTIAPYLIFMKLINEEKKLWPGWEEGEENKDGDDYKYIYAQREKEEWELADRIICGSEFVKNSLLECGVKAEKCMVIPYGVEFVDKNIQKKRGKKLRILTVGTICLRKGIPYVVEAAKRMSKYCEFKLVGSIKISKYALRQISEHVDIVGPLPRSEVKKYYEWADVFLLPSICEGSATVTYEAMSYGIPVICTPNTGSIVRNGVDGYIVPIRDSEKIVDKIICLIDDPYLYNKMRENAKNRAKENDFHKYESELIRNIC